VVWIGLGDDRNKWMVPLKMAVALQVLRKAGNLLTGVATISFCIKRVLHGVCLFVRGGDIKL